MNVEHRQQLLQALWPAGAQPGVWAVLDGARDARIHRALLASRLEVRCLFSGRLSPSLERVAPQLVELPPAHRLFDAWLQEGWGHSWGVFVKIDDPSNLRHHLRKLLKVEGLSRRPVLFRFYDPRVLRAFLPQARPEQLREFFGPVSAWYAEDGNGGLVEFRCDRQYSLLQRQAVAAPPRAALALSEGR